MTSSESADMVVVGAGWYGLSAAKTYLEVHPDVKVILLEAEFSVGGAWASHRLYHGLKSNNMVGTYEYSDFPMDEAIWGVKPGQHIPGNNFGVLERIRFNTNIESVERGEKGGWLLKTSTESTIFAKKLVIATGLASRAFMPTFEGEDSLEAPLFHSKDFLQHKETIKTAKKVTILGGTKSAWDAVYAYASEDVEVDWII